MLSPVHLQARRSPDGSLNLSWIRRGRISSDAWEPVEIPLDANAENYRLWLLNPLGEVVREFETQAAELDYPRSSLIADFGSEPEEIVISVAQIGDNGNAGPPCTITINPSQV